MENVYKVIGDADKKIEQNNCSNLMCGAHLGNYPGVAVFRAFSIQFSRLLTLSWLEDDLKDAEEWGKLKGELKNKGWTDDQFNALESSIQVGSAFIADINSNGLNTAIHNWFGFQFPTPPDGNPWLILALDENSLTGKIEVVNTGKAEGMKLMWTLPYASWPKAAVDHAELAVWAQECDKWIGGGNYSRLEDPFPVPNVPYVPFGTY